MTLEVGQVYAVKHTSGRVPAKFLGTHIIPSYHSVYSQYKTNMRRHFIFENLKTGRQIELKSTQKVLGKLVLPSC